MHGGVVLLHPPRLKGLSKGVCPVWANDDNWLCPWLSFALNNQQFRCSHFLSGAQMWPSDRTQVREVTCWIETRERSFLPACCALDARPVGSKITLHFPCLLVYASPLIMCACTVLPCNFTLVNFRWLLSVLSTTSSLWVWDPQWCKADWEQKCHKQCLWCL